MSQLDLNKHLKKKNNFNEFGEKNLDCIPNKDDDEIDEELRSFRKNLR